MYTKINLPILVMLFAAPLSAQVPTFSVGSNVIASPTMLPDRWEQCTVNRYISLSNGYDLTCGRAKYVVPSRYVRGANEQNAELLTPPAARDLMQAGTEVMASPLYLPDRWERCVIVRPLYENNGYEIKCNSIVYVVSRTQVKPATGQPLESRVTDGNNTQLVPNRQVSGGASTLPAPDYVPDTNYTTTSTPNAVMAEGSVNYYPGMMIEASPMEGVWGDAVVIEQVQNGFRVQMLPGQGYTGAPQLIMPAGRMRQPAKSNNSSPAVPQPTEPEPQENDFLATQDIPDPGTTTNDFVTPQEPPAPAAVTDDYPTTQRLPNGTYYCGKSTGGMVFFMGDIELRDGSYRGPAYDGKFEGWYPMTTTPEGTVNWGGPMGGFESDTSRIVSTVIKSDGGRPAFDVLLKLQSGNFMSISCVPK